MASFISWYILITVLGGLTFPLAYRLFPALADRGYALSRAFGLLIWGYVFWLFGTFGIAQNDLGGLLLGLVIVVGLSAWAFINQKSETIDWIKENLKLIITVELVFLVAFGAFALFRSANPEIIGTEKPMELMFINGIMNSPTFPPRDPWLSGYSISYYYFGYVMTSMMALFTGTSAFVAFNLMLALTYGLAAVSAYGVLYNLLAIGHRSQVTGQKSNADRPSFLLPILGPIFLLLISNVEGFLDVLHRKGFFWQFNADGSATSRFWTWLDMQELSQAPLQPLQWIPERYLWWWRASRVVQDYDLLGNHLEAIDEFPAFSFLLGDLHPHVLAIPFVMLAIAVALNLFLGGWRGKIDLYIGELHVNKTGFFVMAFVLGSLAFLNTWDILLSGAVIVFSYGLARVREAGWSRERTEDIVFLGIPLVVMAYVFFLPFFISFASQASGILPSIMFPTRGAHLWVMWGTLFAPIFAYLIHLLRTKVPANWKAGLGVGLGIVIVLFALMFGIAWLVSIVKPDFILPYVESQQHTIQSFLAAGMSRRLSYIGGLLTLLALLIPAFAFLFADQKHQTESPLQRERAEGEGKSILQPSTFILLLISLGTLLILGPDFVYLQDNFGYRINTIFKFYYQAWLLLSIASAYGAAVLLRRLRGFANVIFSVLFVIVLIVGLTYPILGAWTRTNKFQPAFGFNLDDFDRLLRDSPDEAAAVLWLNSAVDGNIVEATGDPYSNYGRIATYTGMPTVIGWRNHEGQWRDASFTGLLAQRQLDVETIYSTPDWQTTQTLLEQYDVRYVIVGNLERTSYRVNEEKFNNFLRPVFQQGSITIYEVP